MNKQPKQEQTQHSDKAISKAMKKLGNITVDELNALGEQDLKARIIQSNQAMREVEESLANNERYQELKEQMKAMSQGKRDVDARQKAVIKYALHRISEMGKVA